MAKQEDQQPPAALWSLALEATGYIFGVDAETAEKELLQARERTAHEIGALTTYSRGAQAAGAMALFNCQSMVFTYNFPDRVPDFYERLWRAGLSEADQIAIGRTMLHELANQHDDNDVDMRELIRDNFLAGTY